MPVGAARMALALAVAVVAAAPASARDVSVKDRGGVRAKGLTRTERKAVDISRVTATGGSWGLIVRVRLKGDLQNAIGRRHLRRALAAMILEPKRGKGRPAGLATTGRAGRESTLRGTRSKASGVVRNDRTVEFYVFGRGLENVRRIHIRLFRRLPRGRRGARKSDDGTLTGKTIRYMIEGPFFDLDEIDLSAPRLPQGADTFRCAAGREQAFRIRDEINRANAEYEAAKRPGNQLPIKEAETATQLYEKREALRSVLAAEGCLKVAFANVGYKHWGNTSVICGDIEWNLPMAHWPGLGFKLFFKGEGDADFRDITEGAAREFTTPTDSSARFRLAIGNYGTYKLVYDDSDLPSIEIVVVVSRPPPQETRDCPSPPPPG